jgi:hypothetical protein
MQVARHRHVDVELEAATADPQCRDLVVEVRPVDDARADRRLLDARGGGEPRRSCGPPRGGEAQDTARAAVEIVRRRTIGSRLVR